MCRVCQRLKGQEGAGEEGLGAESVRLECGLVKSGA